MYMFWDPTMLLMIPGLLLSLWAGSRVKGTFARYSRVGTASGVTGAQAAAALARSRNLAVRIERSPGGSLSDHFDPASNTLRLSEEVYAGRSVAAVGVAAHEMGHALQKADGYGPLALRNGLVPMANLGSGLSWPLLLLGLVLGNKYLALAGVVVFSLAVLFTLITLPVEFNASKRALSLLVQDGIVSRAELPGAKAVLDAAALTYVAAALSAVLMLLRMVLLARSTDD